MPAATPDLSRPSAELSTHPAIPCAQEGGTTLQLIDGQPVFSATDLVGFLECEHLTALERAALAGLVKRPMRDDPELDVIRRRGEQHEQRFLKEQQDNGRTAVEIERAVEGEEYRDRLERQTRETIKAMADGAEVVYQATFFDGRWLGYADFLLRKNDAKRPSIWGPYHYEVADTKLARHVKAGAVLQICSYIDQLERIQGVRPETMYVALGGSAHETVPLRVDDYMAYYRACKRRFEDAVLGTDANPAPAPTYPSATTYPEPVEHCDVCRWNELCVKQRRADDHLSLVAGISSRERKAFTARNFDTLTKLGTAPLPFEPPIEDVKPAAIEKVHEQARIQVQGRGLPKPIYELLTPVEPERGLATLPEPSAGDLFFDIEGDPYAFDDGLEYLFGVLDTAGTFTPFWAHDPTNSDDITLAGEKHAFEQFMDFVSARLEQYPDLHVFHYAPYEPTALKKLMGRHGTREGAVDDLLRKGVLVDLYRAVKQGIRASVESYSIKKIEALYDFRREINLRDAGSSIAAFEEWLQLGEGERPASDILAGIQAYNRDDVVSTHQLRDFLERLRIELTDETGEDVPRPTPPSGEIPASLSEADAKVQAVVDKLTDGVPPDPHQRTDEQKARWLLAQLLSWHRRESKSTFWEFFFRMDMTAEDLVADKGALGGLEVIGRQGEPFKPTPRSDPRQHWLYRMPPQEHDLNDRSELYDPALRQANPGAKWSEWKVGAKVVTIDDEQRQVTLSWPPGDVASHPKAIVPLNFVRDDDHRAALLRLGTWVADNGVDADGPWRAARDLLLRRAPRAGQAPRAPLRNTDEGETELAAAVRLGPLMDETTLPLQGPPGAGKTYAGAHMILALLADGKKVGITANSHKVIANFLKTICEAADKAETEAPGTVQLRAVQKVSEGDQGFEDPRVTVTTDNPLVRNGLQDGAFNLAAGTSWLWAPDKSDGLLDVLFVDEAGQMSLANVLAMSAATANIVLLGDPQQLDQPVQGSHPPGADRSALAHFLGTDVTMPPDRGLFLEHTWRLHPDIARFTSEAFYKGLLTSMPHLAQQTLLGDGPMTGVGLRLLPANHTGNDNESVEEAKQVAALVRGLIDARTTWINEKGEEGFLTEEDILIVAPYNAQVGAIKRELDPGARVGTVDKFQGQEAPVSIYSMTSSSPEDAPRGMDFLYSRNRLNVATSRARCVTVVVAQPALLLVRARTPEQMRLANALCQFAEMATGVKN
jgi:uncharacterized protein